MFTVCNIACSHQFQRVFKFTTCNSARNNLNLCSLCTTLRATISTCVHYLQHCAQQFQRVFAICNIARNNFNVYSLSATLRATISTCVHYLQHCAQQFQRVFTICNTARDNSNVCSLSATLRATISMCSLSATLRATISTCIHYLQHFAQQFPRVSSSCNKCPTIIIAMRFHNLQHCKQF